MKVNPFTIEVIKDSLMSIGEEMFIALARTSMSPMFYEVLDYACGLTDAKGNLISQGNGVTSFIGMLSPMVQHVLEKYDDGEDLSEGDIIIVNDPYVGGGSHLSDVGLVMPIYYEGELVAFSTNKGHWTEIGGKDPGSFTNNSTEIYQEGLQLPGVKLYEAGRLNEAVVEMISVNVRLPKLSLGDMWAQVAALRTGEKRFKELCQKYERAVVTNTMTILIEQAENYSLKELNKLPKGDFYAKDYIEGDPNAGGPYPIEVKVTITDTEFICDFRGSHPQVKNPVNCSYYGLLASVRVMYLAILQPKFNVNEGLFKPLKIITDENSIVSAKRPAPVSMNFEARIGGAELVWRALASLLPDRLTAGHLLSVCSTLLSGTHPDTKEPFLIVEPTLGGWGAGKNQDGQHGQFCMGNGETYNMPIEIAEARYGIRVNDYRFRCDGAGEGQNVGGSGVVRAYETLTNDQELTVSFGRHLFKPWGMNGGGDGSSSYIEVKKKNGEIIGPFGVSSRLPLEKGDVVHLVTATGGGYGNPYNRPIESVVADVKNGFITTEQAIEKYGVCLDKDLNLLNITTERKRYEATL